MKRTFFNLTKHGVALLSMALLIVSCDGLLPKKISDEETEDYNKSDYAIEDEEEILQTDIDEELPPPLPDEYDNDVSSLSAEHDYGVMTLYEFYSEKYFGNGQYKPERFLSKKLKRAIDGISRLESKTGYIILDYDPFIQAQDLCFSEDQFTVERNGSSNWFTFNYGKKHVQLYLIESNDGYLIDDVKLPSGTTLTKLYEEEKRAAR